MDRRLFCSAMLALALMACDSRRIQELEEGLSTEADVRKRFGEPEAVWDGPAGSRIFEYSRQPSGTANYMITIGADGRMSALRQVLTPQNFARVTPGMPWEEVRRMLGKPQKVTPYALKQETHYDWRYQDGPNTADAKVFTVILNQDLRVLSTHSAADPASDNSNRR